MESPYKASITREQFLFYEMKTTAKLLAEGIDDEKAINRIVSENLFQYPTEREIKRMAKVCCRRLRGMNDMDLIDAYVNSLRSQLKDAMKGVDIVEIK